MDPTVTLGHGDAADSLDAPSAVPSLTLLWSSTEPARAGEVCLLPERGVASLGRAEPVRGELALRLTFVRQRPGQVIPTGALRSPHLSREQLICETERGEVRVKNVGRCPLKVNGQLVDEVTLSPGDVLELQKQVVLLFGMRPRVLPPSPPGTRVRLHPFGEPDEHGLVGESPATWELRERVAFVAPRAAHVLVRGASGTGKELVAQALHALSDRRSRPMIARNAATIPESLVDAELFGNARNYPNPGMAERPGLVGEADGSTLFLDEFGELPIPVQAHLLRVLDAGEYTRLGEARPRTANLRLVAATNRPESMLKEDVRARFRLRIEVPPLGERIEDLPLLVRVLLQRIALEDRALAGRFFPDGDLKGWPALSSELVVALARRSWPTNVRELEGVLWESLAQSRGNVLEGVEEPVTSTPSGSSSVVDNGIDPMSIPKDVVQACLDKHGGRQEPVWRELGLSSRHVLARLVRRHGLSVRGRSGRPDDDGPDE